MINRDREGRISMPGGRARSVAPIGFARDPESWPNAEITDDAARVVQHMARALGAEIARRGLSVRGAAVAAGVNRQTLGDVLGGARWPDVVTVVQIESGLGCALWPGMAEIAVRHV